MNLMHLMGLTMTLACTKMKNQSLMLRKDCSCQHFRVFTHLLRLERRLKVILVRTAARIGMVQAPFLKRLRASLWVRS
uniref:Uncharacterized protein n=1 Tax=Arundo donax TaxID=35708 RepID=A0A0A9F5C8_ARUDO